MDPPITLPGGPLGTATGVLLIIMGLGAVLFPALIFTLLIVFLASYAIIVSLELIRCGLSGPGSASRGRTTQIIIGCAGILLGLVILIAPYLVSVAAKDLFAIWAVLTGAGNLLAIISGGSGTEKVLGLISGIVLAALGIVILVSPALMTMYILVLILGLFAIMTGIFSIWLARAESDEVRTVNHSIYK